jgi:hypothetical protein
MESLLSVCLRLRYRFGLKMLSCRQSTYLLPGAMPTV